ncbi:MAG TPA: 3'(2'),5'-bisphosphate nucleotidase CysQ [Chitinophagaceae bacterium]|nr:3'(2'),5'-bisphosphate nucleotidase CysQ [Chitinophagaceae bacterium]
MMNLLNVSISAAIEAGKKILEIYKRDFSVETKADKSPLTEADKQSHNVIKDALAGTGIPMLSEEGKQMDYEDREGWDTFWLIDPLDGTKEFIKKNGEFTVNIALIKAGIPVLGVVYVPVTGVLYYGQEGKGSYCFNTADFEGKQIEEMISGAKKLPVAATGGVYTIVASRSHNTPETEAFIDERKNIHSEVNLISAGSSIKLCLVAEGKANVYPRLAPTMEWDTAAGHAVAKFAGCSVYDYNAKKELVYNKENLLNPWFVVERA